MIAQGAMALISSAAGSTKMASTRMNENNEIRLIVVPNNGKKAIAPSASASSSTGISAPLPAMFVAMVTTPGFPASATISASFL